MKIEFLNGTPPETLGMLSDSGYINSDLFIEWLDHFKQHTKPSLDSPVLLILNNHSSHVNLKTVSFCMDNFIHLLSIPPHTSHRTQTLDRCFFKSLKDNYSVFYDLWTTTHPRRTVGLYQVGEIFGSANCQNSTVLKAINAFEMCGIWPLNPFIFTDDDFLPSSVTDQNILEPNINNDNDNILDGSNLISQKIGNDYLNILDMPIEIAKVNNGNLNILNNIVQNHQSNENLNQQKEIAVINITSTSNQVNVSPSDIIPLPKMTEKRMRKKKGKRSEILSGTPYKEALEKAENEKEQKKIKRIKK